MMDPLSIAASVVALIGAANQIAKGVNALASLRGAPAFFLSLNNELSDILLVLTETEVLLEEHRFHPDDSTPAKRLFPSLKHVWDLIQDVRGIEKRLTKRSGSLDRLAWVWEHENINRAQKGLRTARADLMFVLGFITSKSAFRIETQLEEVHSIAIENNASISQSINQQGESLRQILELQRKYETVNWVTETLPAYEKQTKASAVDESKKEVGRRYSDSSGTLFEDAQFSALRMRFLRRRKCNPWCACRCHSHKRLNTPRLLQSVVGQLFVGYAGVPLLTESCDLPDQCQGTGESFMQFNYYFPTWFLSRVMTFSLRKSEFQRPEYSLRVLNIRSTFEAIFVGSEGNDAALVRSLISNDRASVLDITDGDGHSALHLAVKRSHVEVARALLEMGAEPYLENITQETPYDMAWSTILCFQDTPNAAEWRVEEMRALFPSLNSIEERRQFTKIHKIINRILHCDLERELSRSPDLINQVDADGRTALSYAAARGEATTVDILLRYGADPNIADRIGQGPLRQSMKAHESTCTTLLLNAGANANHRDNWEQTSLIISVWSNEPLTFVSTLLLAEADIDASDFQGSTVLMEAMKANSPDPVLKLLLDSGARINEVDSFGMSVLMQGIRHNSHRALRFLLNSGLHIIHSGSDNSRKTVLHWAAEAGDTETLKILTHTSLEDLSIHDKTDTGLTAIDVAEKRRELERTVDEKAWTDNTWLDAFRDLLETARIPTVNPTPKSAASWRSDMSEEMFYDALQHLSFEGISELVEEGGVKYFAK